MLGDMPNVLILHLQRIVFSFETFSNEKINTEFQFPEILDLNKFSFAEVMQAAGKSAEDFKKDDKLLDLLKKEDDDYIYRLAGVNIHRGNGDHGHYWSLINTKRGTAEPDP